MEELQEEVGRMNTENQKLKEMLNHANNEYTKLEMRFESLLQQQQNQRLEHKVRNNHTAQFKLFLYRQTMK